MNEMKQGNDDRRILAPILGFVLGAIVGGGVALLFAPASGAHTRRRLGTAARRMTDDARHAMEEARDTVTEAASGLGSDVKSAIEAGREAFRHEGESQEPRPGSRLAQMLNPPSTRTP